MDNGPIGLVEYMNQTFGTAFTALSVAVAGRLMFHAQEVRSKRRKFFGWELLWEAPASVALAFIGNGIGAYFSLGLDERIGVIGLVSYLGPKALDVAVQRIIEHRLKKDD